MLKVPVLGKSVEQCETNDRLQLTGKYFQVKILQGAAWIFEPNERRPADDIVTTQMSFLIRVKRKEVTQQRTIY